MRLKRIDESGLLPLVAILALLGIGFVTVGWFLWRELLGMIALVGFILIVAAGGMWALGKGVKPKAIAGMMVFLLLFSAIAIAIFGGMMAVVTVDDTANTCAMGNVYGKADNTLKHLSWCNGKYPLDDGVTGDGLYSGKGPGGAGYQYHEVLDDDDYIASWASDMNGQVVNMQGKIAGGFLEAYRFRVYINTGTEWKLQKDFMGQAGSLTNIITGGMEWRLTPNHQFQLTDQPHGSGIKVRLQVKVASVLDEWKEGSDTFDVAVDEARIIGGIGDIDFDKDLYAVNETARITTRVNYVTDGEGRGWKVDVFSTASNKIVYTSKVTSTVQTFSYRVVASDFAVSSDCRNELHSILTNEIMDKDFDDSAIVDIREYAPTVTIKGFTPAKPVQGDNVTVKWEAKPNSKTNLPLTKFVMRYGPGEAQEVEYGPTATEGTFIAGLATKYHVEVFVYDSGCRPNSADLDIYVSEPGDGGGDLSNIPWLLIVGIVLAACGFIVAATIKKYRIYGLITGVVGVAIVIWQFVGGAV